MASISLAVRWRDAYVFQGKVSAWQIVAHRGATRMSTTSESMYSDAACYCATPSLLVVAMACGRLRPPTARYSSRTSHPGHTTNVNASTTRCWRCGSIITHPRMAIVDSYGFELCDPDAYGVVFHLMFIRLGIRLFPVGYYMWPDFSAVGHETPNDTAAP